MSQYNVVFMNEDTLTCRSKRATRSVALIDKSRKYSKRERL